MKEINASEFKAKCLAILDQVAQSGQAVTITKRGKPLARVVPPIPEQYRYPQEALFGTVEIHGDIVRYEDIGLWFSDMPHLDAADVWEAMDNMNKWNVPRAAQEKMLGGNARRLYGIEPRLVVTQAPDEYTPVTMSRYAS